MLKIMSYTPPKITYIFLDDYFVVRITEDPVFGTPVFTTMVTRLFSSLYTNMIPAQTMTIYSSF